MSTYRHKLISEMGPNFTMEHMNSVSSSGHSYRDTVLLDDVPVIIKLQEFGMEVRKKFPAIKFYANPNESNRIGYVTTSAGGSLNVFSDVYVYVDNCPYMLGRIGWGKKFGVQELDEAVYMVQSRKINNSKYAEWRDQASMIFSKDMKKAVKSASANLLPYTVPEVASISFQDYKNSVNTDSFASKNNLHEKIKPIMYAERIAEEMANMVAAGLQFHSKELQDMAIEVSMMYNEMLAKQSNKRPSAFVSARMMGAEQWFDVIEVPTAKNGEVPLNTPIQSYLFGNLPASIQEKLAVLTTCNHGQFIPDVGRRVSDTTFWVEK